MNHGRVCRAQDRQCLIPNAGLTSNIFERMRGLLGAPRLKTEEALLIRPCSSVHTIGMNYAIDLAFMDKNWTIIKIVRNLKPWRMAACPAAHMVLELLGGGIDRLQLTRGLQLAWQDEQA